MKTFEVEIQATVRKTIVVKAPDEDAAYEWRMSNSAC